MVISIMSSYVLGIDIGTSTVKAVLVERGGVTVAQESNQPLGSRHADVPSISGAKERGLSEIWTCLETCIRALDASKLQDVCAISVCGQMHGCVLWRDEAGQLDPDDTLAVLLADGNCSNLVTWQDERCTQSFLSSLPKTRQRVSVSAGYGCATLAWLQQHQREVVERYHRAGTIMDFIVWRLSSSSSKRAVIMSPQNATSWGYFDSRKRNWELELYVSTDRYMADSNHGAFSLG